MASLLAIGAAQVFQVCTAPIICNRAGRTKARNAVHHYIEPPRCAQTKQTSPVASLFIAIKNSIAREMLFAMKGHLMRLAARDALVYPPKKATSPSFFIMMVWSASPTLSLAWT
jgi:hypothetical protein